MANIRVGMIGGDLHALYYGVLSGISLSGDRYFYKNPLASRGDVKRSPSWNPACCQSNLVRIIPQVGTMAYATGPSCGFPSRLVCFSVPA